MKNIILNLLCLFICFNTVNADDVNFIVTNEYYGGGGMPSTKGSIKITVNNDQQFLQPFTISWTGQSSGSAVFSGNMYTIANLYSGEYCVSITTLDGCSLSKCMWVLYCQKKGGDGGTIGYITCDSIALEPGSPTELIQPFTDDENITTREQITDEKLEVTVYPNPINDVLNLRANKELKLISLYNSQGIFLIKNNNINTNIIQLDFSFFTSGVYFLIISDKQEYLVRKLIKI